MHTAEKQFQLIAEKLCAEDGSVTTGKMMSSPGIRYQDKVFAFYYRETMVFRLGRAFDPTTIGVHDYQLLSPFKTKPPLVDWFEVMPTHLQQWEALARLALERMRDTKGKPR
jgi:hypothetical protein